MIYKYRTEGRTPKGFSNYQNLIDLLINLNDDNINPKEVLKNQLNFKSDLGGIKKSKSKIKNRKLNKCNTKYFSQKIINLREKIIPFLRDYSFLLSEAKYKVKYGSGLKILTPKQMLQRF